MCSRARMGSLLSMRKKGDSFECSFGMKLYAAHARGTKTSHSNCGATCLAIQALRKAWNPFYPAIGCWMIRWSINFLL